MIKKYGAAVIVAVLFLAASFAIYVKLHPKKLPANLVMATGKIDADIITLNTKYPGRVLFVSIVEGQRVKEGEVLARLGSEEAVAKKEGIEAQIEALNAEKRALRMEFLFASKRQSRNVEKAKSSLAIARERLAALQKRFMSLEALVAQDLTDLNRTRDLYGKKLIARHTLELAELKWKNDNDTLLAMRHRIQEAKAAVAIADEEYRLAGDAKEKVAALKERIDALGYKIDALKAAKKEVMKVIEEMTIRAPIDARVIERIANEGEVLGAGMNVATLVSPKDYYLKVYVDTIQNGKIKLGDKAEIFLDAAANDPIAAKVVRIAAAAEFTPKEVAIRSDRIERVYAVYLKPLVPNPLLKLGLPAIGVISLDGKGLPKSLTELPEL